MSADAARRLHEEPDGTGRPASLVCTLAGPDGQAIGRLTIDLDPTSGYGAERADDVPGRGAALVPPEGAASSELRLRLPASWTERGRPELAIHAVLVRDGAVVDERDFGVPAARMDAAAMPRAPLAEMVAGYERALIEDALRGTRGNRARAARLLQTTERILGYRIQQYGIDCREFRKKP